jgi:hypothetical protein
MDNQVPKYVTQERASLLLGIPEQELSRISNESELGHTEPPGFRKRHFAVVFLSSKLADYRLGGP